MIPQKQFSEAAAKFHTRKMLESCGKESLLISFQIIVRFPQYNTSFQFIIRDLATQYLGVVISHKMLAKASSTVSGFCLR